MVLLVMDNEKDEWKQISKEEKSKLPLEEQEKVLFLPEKLKEKLDFALSQQRKDNDCVGIVAGDEGSGKSSLAGNIMIYISKNKFDPKKDLIGSDYEDGIDKIHKVKYRGGLMFDEGNIFFLGTETMKREHRDLHKIFSIFRQKALFVLIVLPSFFRLGSYFALDRSKFLCITYLKKGKRSYFKYFGEKKKFKLYMKGKKTYNDKVVQPRFRARFLRCYLLETEDYKKFKLHTLADSIKEAKEKVKKKISPSMVEQHYRKEIIKNNTPRLTGKQLAEMLGVKELRIKQIRREIKEEQMIPKTN